MHTTQSIIRKPISRSAFSIALLMGSALWLVGTWAYYATSAFRSDWSATPLFWMLIVVAAPAICFGIGMILVDTRKHSRFSPLVWCALLAGLFPVTLGTVLAFWTIKALFSMSGMGM
ncbi:MAG TPA: hypothetical protein VN578_11660 [Candidatus Binatia bacterium]|jgi:hypothetical protein|nr:hypothetical protein [Candidatus Binatia bacterium]